MNLTEALVFVIGGTLFGLVWGHQSGLDDVATACAEKQEFVIDRQVFKCEATGQWRE